MTFNQSIFSVIEVMLVVMGLVLLWYKLFLPISYFVIVILFAMFLTFQILTRNRPLVLQIMLLLFFMNSIYYASTNYKIIPFWDGNWDFGVVKTFTNEGRIYQIVNINPISNLRGDRPAAILSNYSGWPLLHSLIFLLSQVSGISVFQIFLILPYVISGVSFLFVYLIIEKIRISLGLNTIITNVALLMYTVSAEALFWNMQLVRQSMGLMLYYIIVYLFYVLETRAQNARKRLMLTIFFGMTLVIAHHFSSFILAFFFLMFFVVQKAQRYIGKVVLGSRSSTIALSLALICSTFMFLWWNCFSTAYIWRQIDNTLTRFLEALRGIRKLEFTPKSAYYPEILTQSWAILLNILRDIIIYVPMFFGLAIILIKKGDFLNNSDRMFITNSSIALGLIIIINNFTIRVEVFRLFSMMLPLTALLSTTFYYYVIRRNLGKEVRKFWKALLVGGICMFLIFAASIGLWGHRFAPLHLYDSSVKYSDVGERNIDSIRIGVFLDKNVNISHFHVIWVDDDASLVPLLQPVDYPKIMRLGSYYIEVHQAQKLSINELICEFENFNIYHYFAGASTSVTPKEVQTLRHDLYEFFKDCRQRVYDDGKYRLWVYEGAKE